MENVIKECEVKMKKSVDIFHEEIKAIRTGRANISVLHSVKVPYYGQMMPINQVAGLTLTEAKTINVKPWDKNILPEIEKAILTANLGLSVVNVGDSLKVNFPELTEETRKEYVKKVKKMGEEAKINIRNIRREINEKIHKMQKDKLISEDDMKHGEDRVQKITDKYIKEIDEIVKAKEQELMVV